MGRPAGSKNKTTTIKITNPGSNAVNKKKLQALVERIEVIEEQKADLARDLASVYEEVADSEFDKKAVRACVKLRKKSKAERETESEIIDLYMAALGDFATTELGQAGARSFHVVEDK